MMNQDQKTEHKNRKNQKDSGSALDLLPSEDTLLSIADSVGTKGKEIISDVAESVFSVAGSMAEGAGDVAVSVGKAVGGVVEGIGEVLGDIDI